MASSLSAQGRLLPGSSGRQHGWPPPERTLEQEDIAVEGEKIVAVAGRGEFGGEAQEVIDATRGLPVYGETLSTYLSFIQDAARS